MREKIRVGVLMGGASAEREISLASGRMIAQNLPREKYDVLMLDTLALMAFNPNLPQALRKEVFSLTEERTRLLPESFREGVLEAVRAAAPATLILREKRPIEVAFIALHGP